jgi:prepilin-type N-terminal cleavage/methylation domain-containing protein
MFMIIGWIKGSKSKKKSKVSNGQEKPLKTTEKGFSLLETTAALVIFLVATLGVYTTFTYSVSYNAGNSSRSQALSVLQQKVEQLRSAKFTPGKTDDELKGGVKTPETLTAPDGSPFRVETTVDDDPFTDGVQIDSTNKAVTLKEITVKVVLDRPAPGWQTAIPATIVLRRVRGN